jgi:hypothetical protein
MGAGAYIHDFVHSKNPKFKGKSKKKRIQMALGAFYGSKNFHGKEDFNPIIADSPILETLGEIEFLERDTPDLNFKVHPLEGNRVRSEINGVRYHHFPKEGMAPAEYQNRIMSIYAYSPGRALAWMKQNSRGSRRLQPEPRKLSDVGY